jgi:hypothetical protein
MTKLLLRASTPDEMAASFYVDLDGALIAWSLHTTDTALVLRALEAITALSRTVRRSAVHEGEVAPRVHVQLPEGSEVVVTFWAEELAVWSAHPSELMRHERADWRHFLAMCEASAKAAGVPGAITTLTREQILAVYFPALDRWLACEPFDETVDTDV